MGVEMRMRTTPEPSWSASRGSRRGRSPASIASKSRGTPGRMCTLPPTTPTGTHKSSLTKITCSASGTDSSVGSSTMRFFACSAGESASQSKFGCEGCGLDRRFIRSKAAAWSCNGSPNALAIDG